MPASKYRLRLLAHRYESVKCELRSSVAGQLDGRHDAEHPYLVDCKGHMACAGNENSKHTQHLQWLTDVLAYEQMADSGCLVILHRLGLRVAEFTIAMECCSSSPNHCDYRKCDAGGSRLHHLFAGDGQ